MIKDDLIKHAFLKNADIDLNFDYIQDLLELEGVNKINIIQNSDSYKQTAITFSRGMSSYIVEINDEKLVLILFKSKGYNDLGRPKGKYRNNMIAEFEGLDAWGKLASYIGR